MEAAQKKRSEHSLAPSRYNLKTNLRRRRAVEPSICRDRLLARQCANIQTQTLRHAFTIRRIGLIEVLDLQLLDALRRIAEAAHNIVDQALPGIRWHQPVQIARLRVVIRIAAMIV